MESYCENHNLHPGPSSRVGLRFSSLFAPRVSDDEEDLPVDQAWHDGGMEESSSFFSQKMTSSFLPKKRNSESSLSEDPCQKRKKYSPVFVEQAWHDGGMEEASILFSPSETTSSFFSKKRKSKISPSEQPRKKQKNTFLFLKCFQINHPEKVIADTSTGIFINTKTPTKKMRKLLWNIYFFNCTFS